MILLSQLSNIENFSFPLKSEQEARFADFLEKSLPNTSFLERQSFIEELKNQETLLFHQWVNNHKSLVQVFLNQFDWKRDTFVDSFAFEKHVLFSNFKNWISSSLMKQIGTLSLENEVVRMNVLKVSSLLNKVNVEVVHAWVSEVFQTKHSALFEKLKPLKSDQAILDNYLFEITPSHIRELNSLDRSQYNTIARLVEETIDLVHHPKSSRRLLLALCSEMEKIQLDKEHKDQIINLRLDLKQGNYQLEKTKISWKRWFKIAGLFLLVIAIFLTVVFLPNAEVVRQNQEKTAYMYLSKEERSHIDSLFRQIEGNRREQVLELKDFEMDLEPMDLKLIKKKEWANQAWLKCYQTWIKKKNAPSVAISKSINSASGNPKGTQHLDAHKGEVSILFQNESDQQILILVFDDVYNKSVYAKYVNKNQTSIFSMNALEYLIVVPGGEAANNDFPFKEFDQRFFTHIENYYQLENNLPHKASLIYKDISGYNTYLVDIKERFKKNQ